MGRKARTYFEKANGNVFSSSWGQLVLDSICQSNPNHLNAASPPPAGFSLTVGSRILTKDTVRAINIHSSLINHRKRTLVFFFHLSLLPTKLHFYNVRAILAHFIID